MRTVCVPAEELTLQAISAEVFLARSKFPSNRLLLSMLVEEVGELARALLQRKDRDDIEKEAIQVAAVAVRIIEEADATFDDVFEALERLDIDYVIEQRDELQRQLDALYERFYARGKEVEELRFQLFKHHIPEQSCPHCTVLP